MTQEELALEESLTEDWSKDLEIVEVPIVGRAMKILGLVLFAAGVLIATRVFWISFGYDSYRERAYLNVAQQRELPAPRGVIYDRNGEILADNEASFLVFLDAHAFINERQYEQTTLEALEKYAGLTSEEVWELIRTADLNQRAGNVLLADDVPQEKIIQLKGLGIKTLSFENGFKRIYPDGAVFSSIVGYTALVNADDLAKDPLLTTQTVVGRSGIERFYDEKLRGKSGTVLQLEDAKGNKIGEPEAREPVIGQSLHVTIDAELQSYFYTRLTQGLRELGRSVGVGMAMNPENGEILALLNIPSFDNNLFVTFGNNEEKRELLHSPMKPLFNRAVSGMYNPGSTIKPLVALAALEEEVVTPEKEIFSPGYLDVPNPYNPENPTRLLDWRYQGFVDMAAAIAQSSNVYFYIVGGGFEDAEGLGITRLREWWKNFNLGSATGIDLPGEANGLLPDAEQKKKTTGTEWLVGDTYNVSIGQGDLLLTPLQILNYISVLGNGGRINTPFINKDVASPRAAKDLSYALPHIKEVRKGMEETVRSSLGTAHSLSDLPFSVAAKTGSAQVRNNAQENAFFVGYAPVNNPQIAILVLIEEAKQGSINTLPIAKDVLSWYYENRIRK